MQNRPAYPVGAADTVPQVLLLLSGTGELRVSDTAARPGIARSTAHRILAMLVLHGFAEKDGRRIYRTGPALRHVAGSLGLPRALLTAAHSTLRQLASSRREAAHLMVLEGNGVRFIDGVEGPQTLRLARGPECSCPPTPRPAARPYLPNWRTTTSSLCTHRDCREAKTRR